MPILEGYHVIVDLRDYKEKIGRGEAHDVSPLSLIPEDAAREIEGERAALEAGRAIYEMRKDAGLTQQALAPKTGFDQAFIARIEKGRTPQGPTHQTFITITKACGFKLRLEREDMGRHADGADGQTDGSQGQKAAVHAFRAKRAKI